MKIHIPKKIEGFLIAIVGLSLFAYIFLKASYAGFTHDESFSYLHYPHKSFIDIISFSDWFTNNHILNTLFMKYSEPLFGNSELALRLPNLLLLIVYMLYAFFLLKETSFILKISIFLLLCTNVYLMDLFGMARGYGLSFGFMLMSLYFYIAYLNTAKKTTVYLFHFAGLLACLSSFSLVTFYVCLLAIYLPIQYLYGKHDVEKNFKLIHLIKPHIIPFFIVVVFLYEPMRRVIFNSDLDFGGKSSFYSNTVQDIISICLHGSSISSYLMMLLKLLFSIPVLISLFIIIRMYIQKNIHFSKKTKVLLSSHFSFFLFLLSSFYNISL